jgi:uncharacterized membrane protein YedE/YeeE
VILLFSALLSGLIFGMGLMVSGMTDPAKVLAFLDLAGAWDPSLALVMIGAIGAARVGFALAARRQDTLLNTPLHLPERQDADRRLFLGSALFGVGWGLAGFCPGPAVVATGMGYGPATVVVIAILAGMWVADRLTGKVDIKQREIERD